MRALTLIPWLLLCPVIANSQQQPDTIRSALERLYAENSRGSRVANASVA